MKTSTLLFLTHILEQSDMLTVTGIDAAQYYVSYHMLVILPLPVPCQMGDFGVIMRTDRLLSSATLHVVQALCDAG